MAYKVLEEIALTAEELKKEEKVAASIDSILSYVYGQQGFVLVARRKTKGVGTLRIISNGGDVEQKVTLLETAIKIIKAEKVDGRSDRPEGEGSSD